MHQLLYDCIIRYPSMLFFPPLGSPNSSRPIAADVHRQLHARSEAHIGPEQQRLSYPSS